MTSILFPFNDAINDLFTGSTALTSQLGGTVIFRNDAPDNQPLPYVVWNWQSFIDENITPSKMFNNILNVRAFSATKAQADTIYGLIDDLLDGHTITITGWTNFYTVRTMPFEDVNIEPNGVKTNVAGGLYRIRAG